MKITIIFLLAVFLLPVYSQGQSSKQVPVTDYSPLTPGTQIPDIFLANMINRPGNVNSLATLSKGKLLIIDCFATWCGSCILILPKLDSLQKKFSNDLVILPVTPEPKTTIENFLVKHPEFSKMMFVTDETAFSQLFPHRGLPHEVWIDKSGRYITNTFDDNLTANDIGQALKGNFSALIPKNDNMSYDNSVPFLTDKKQVIDSTFLFRSMLTGYKPGIGPRVHVFFDKNKKYTRIICTNLDVLKLYTIAYSKFTYGAVNMKRMEFNLRDSSAYLTKKIKGSHQQWIRTHGYCYEMIVPHPISDSLFFRYMMEDLNRYFNIKGTIEPREITGWDLVRISKDNNLLASKGGEVQGTYTGHLQNMPLSNLINFLNGYDDMELITDKTGYTGPVDMDLDFVRQYERGSYPNMSVIRIELNKYGLDLKKVNKKAPVLVIDYKTGEY